MIFIPSSKSNPWDGMVDPEAIAADLNKNDKSWLCTPADIVKVLNAIYGIVEEKPQEDSPEPEKSEKEKQDEIASIGAFNRFGDSWMANFYGNLPFAKHGIHRVMEIISKHKAPVMLLSAGESIIPNLDLIWEHKDQLLIFAVDHSWRMVPCDFVFSLDSQPCIIPKYFSSSWGRAKGRYLITQTYTNPVLPRKWSKAGGEVLWFHAGYADAMPANLKSENEKQLGMLSDDVKQLAVHCSGFNTTLSMFAAHHVHNVIVVGCDYCWNQRYYFDMYPVDPIDPDFYKLHNDEKPMTITGSEYEDEHDGLLYTTKKLQHMAQITVEDFTPKIIAHQKTGPDGGNFLEFNKIPGIQNMKFVSKPNGLIQPPNRLGDLIDKFLVPNKSEIMAEIEEAIHG